MRRLRVFVDTSVFGGCFDEGFDKASIKFFEEVKSGRFSVVVSPRIVLEVNRARAEVQQVLSGLKGHVEIVRLHDEMTELRNAYLDEGVLGEASADDAEHIAVASVANVDLLISWNFKHIVHFDKIRAYNAINQLNGYRLIDIRSPQEVAEYEDDS